MATFKLDVSKRYGKFFYKFFQSGQQPKESDAHEGLTELLTALRKEYAAGDSVIFRGMAYDNFNDIAAVVRGARY